MRKSLKTHNFLQPAEAKANTNEEGRDEISLLSVSPKPTPPSVEHLLPGGFGTYSISHVSYFNTNNNNNQSVPKPEASLFTVHQGISTDRNDENSNCSSYTSSAFTLWEDSALKAGKENNVADKPILEVGKWMLSDRRTSQSFSNNHHNNFNSRSSSQITGQKNQSFLEMMQSAKDDTQDEDLKNEETFFLKKESQRDSTCYASLFLTVIEYIHFLQEKVHKYEGSFQGWNHDPEKLMPWINNDKASESFEHGGTNSGSVPSPPFLFASKTDEKNITISPTIPGSAKNVESGLNTATNFKPMDHQTGIMNNVFPIPISSQPNFFTTTQSEGQGGVVSQLKHKLSSDAENAIYQPLEECQTMMATSEKLKDKELTIEGGAISISSVYSKGLLDTLTHALQSSGVDLSQASISVQIELGKQSKMRQTVPMSMCGAKGDEVHSDQAVKKLKTCRT
ncbi:hypothetical protein Lal_00040786 [Lupinus albus]|nr:hypothetical protein Lal_00040786 [Lupinus albus]